MSHVDGMMAPLYRRLVVLFHLFFGRLWSCGGSFCYFTWEDVYGFCTGSCDAGSVCLDGWVDCVVLRFALNGSIGCVWGITRGH
jgi:hypothetical protein